MTPITRVTKFPATINWNDWLYLHLHCVNVKVRKCCLWCGYKGKNTIITWNKCDNETYTRKELRARQSKTRIVQERGDTGTTQSQWHFKCRQQRIGNLTVTSSLMTMHIETGKTWNYHLIMVRNLKCHFLVANSNWSISGGSSLSHSLSHVQHVTSTCACTSMTLNSLY